MSMVTYCRSSWAEDKHFLGSYSSNMTPDYSPKLSDIMLQPIYCNDSPVILFAGEAYHKKWMSTLQGAYDTGVQQANQILKHVG